MVASCASSFSTAGPAASTRLRHARARLALGIRSGRTRVAKGGRDVLHKLAEDVPTAAALGQLRYGPLTGTVALVRAP